MATDFNVRIQDLTNRVNQVHKAGISIPLQSQNIVQTTVETTQTKIKTTKYLPFLYLIAPLVGLVLFCTKPPFILEKPKKKNQKKVSVIKLSLIIAFMLAVVHLLLYVYKTLQR